MGRWGADTLSGGLGDDGMWGGLDTDSFVFEGNFGNDLLMDFTDGTEKVDVSAVAGASAGTLGTSIGGSCNIVASFDGGVNTIEFVGITNVLDITDADFLF